MTVCPVCGDEAEAAPDQVCAACGARIPSSAGETSGLAGSELSNESPKSLAAEPEPAIAAAPAQDELVAAFQAQFEHHGVYLPPKWIARLRTLATEVETSRRFATVFFVDLRGYTEMSRLMSDAQLDRLRQWFYEAATKRVEQYGGFVIQLVGDAVFAAFGAPWAFERDSESAVRALLDLREDVRSQGSFEGFPLALRAGADFGPLNVRVTETQGQARPDLFGSTVNLAARLEGQAETWEILLSENMAEQVRHAFVLEKRPAFVPKNYGREVAPSAVVAARPDAGAGRRRHDLEFVGRDAELQSVRDAAKAVGTGAFRDLRVIGEAGVGKTRLVLHALATVSPATGGETDPAAGHNGGMAIALVGCEPHYRFALLEPMLRLVRQVAKTLAGLEPSAEISSNEVLASVRAALLDQDPEAEVSLIPMLGFLLGAEPYAIELRSLPPQLLRTQSVAVLAEFFALCTRLRPWAIVIDDEQWSDRLTQETLNLLRERAPSRLLLVTIGRGEEEKESFFEDLGSAARLELARSAPSGSTVTVQLGPLPPAEQERLLDQIIAPDSIHPLLRQRVLQDSEGVPLYLIETGQEIADWAAQTSGFTAELFAHVAATDESQGLPTTILGLLQARIDRLMPRHRALLQSASVVGRRFSYNVVSLLPTLQEDLLAELYALKGLQMVRDEPIPNDIQFVFTPTALHNAAYHMLTQEQRRSLHATVAGLVESKFKARLADFTFDLAYHWIRAGQTEKARRHVRKAVLQSLSLGAPHDSYDLLSRLLAATGSERSLLGAVPDGGLGAEEMVRLQQWALLEEAGGLACRSMENFAGAEVHFRTLLEIATHTSNLAWQANAHHHLAILSSARGDSASAHNHLNTALDILAETSGSTVAASLTCNVARTEAVLLYQDGKLDDALEGWAALAERIRAQTEHGGTSAAVEATRADCLNNCGLVHWQLGRLEEALASMQSAHDEYDRLGNAYGVALAQSNMGIVQEKLGRFSEALESYDAAASASERIGYLIGLSAIESNRANLRLIAGHYGLAYDAASRSVHYAKLCGHRESEVIALNNQSLAAYGLGLVASAHESAQEALALALEIGVPKSVEHARLGRAHFLAHDGETDRAREELAQLRSDVPGYLADWRETLQALCESLDAGTPEPLFGDEQIARFDAHPESTVENRVRRLDALLHLSRLGIAPSWPVDAIESRRQKLLGDLATPKASSASSTDRSNVRQNRTLN